MGGNMGNFYPAYCLLTLPLSNSRHGPHVYWLCKHANTQKSDAERRGRGQKIATNMDSRAIIWIIHARKWEQLACGVISHVERLVEWSELRRETGGDRERWGERLRAIVAHWGKRKCYWPFRMVGWSAGSSIDILCQFAIGTFALSPTYIPAYRVFLAEG